MRRGLAVDADAVVTQLSHPDPRTRARAARLLPSIDWPKLTPTGWDALSRVPGPLVVDALITVLKDGLEKPFLFWKEPWLLAAEMLGRAGDSRAIKPLFDGLFLNDSDLERQAGKALAVLGEDALALLLRCLTAREYPGVWSADRNYFYRSRVAKALGQSQDPRARDALVARLLDGREHSDVQQAAVCALTNIGSEEAIEPIRVWWEAQTSVWSRRIGAQTLKALGWQPQEPEDRISFLIALGEWDALADVGTAVVAPVVAALDALDLMNSPVVFDLLGVLQRVRDRDPQAMAPVRKILAAVDGYSGTYGGRLRPVDDERLARLRNALTSIIDPASR